MVGALGANAVKGYSRPGQVLDVGFSGRVKRERDGTP